MVRECVYTCTYTKSIDFMLQWVFQGNGITSDFYLGLHLIFSLTMTVGERDFYTEQFLSVD